MHINQFIAQMTGISRRAADTEIKAGKVRINGKIALPPDRVLDGDRVTYKGKEYQKNEVKTHTTIILHKPKGYITSRKRDETGAPTVMELLPKELQQLRPVGRLDKESEGLLLLTDDGDFLYESTHPKFEIEKEYDVEFENYVHEGLIAQWKKGVRLREGIAVADQVERTGRKKLRVIIHQGMNRQIRRMGAEAGNAVIGLRRIRSGEHRLGTLRPGKWKKV